jgi:hypothetical protein
MGDLYKTAQVKPVIVRLEIPGIVTNVACRFCLNVVDGLWNKKYQKCGNGEKNVFP